MGESRRLNGSFGNEFYIDIGSLMELLPNHEFAPNNSITGNAENLFDIDCLNYCTSFGNCNRSMESIDDVTFVSAGVKIPGGSEDLANGLDISPCLNNWCDGSLKRVHESPAGCTESLASGNNGKIEIGDSEFDIHSVNLVKEGTTKKLTNETFKSNDDCFGLVETLDETGEDNVKCETRKNRSLVSADFAVEEVKQFGSVSTRSPVPEQIFSDDELLTLTTKELNRRVRSLPKSIVDEIKQRRRTLKNPGYARLSRDKKSDETNVLKKSKQDLEIKLADTYIDVKRMEMDRDNWKDKCHTLTLHLKELGIEVEL